MGYLDSREATAVLRRLPCSPNRELAGVFCWHCEAAEPAECFLPALHRIYWEFVKAIGTLNDR